MNKFYKDFSCQIAYVFDSRINKPLILNTKYRIMSLSSLKLHNAMWPGLVGKGDDEGQEPPISLERMLDLTAAAEVDGRKFDGIDYFLFLPIPTLKQAMMN